MTQLEQSIRDICGSHNLQSFTVGLLLPNDRHGSGWTVGLQRWAGDEAIGCWHGHGNSIAGALKAAIAQVAAESPKLADEPLRIGEVA